MARKLAVELSEDQWRSVLAGEFNDVEGFHEGVVEAIRKALCPEGHTDGINYTVRTSTVGKRYAWFVNDCILCYETLWGIWHDDIEKGTYRYWDALKDTQIIFLPGGPDDPNKVDIYGVINVRDKDTYEWQKL